MLTAAQIEERRTGIGGSDAGAILGVHPYRSPLDVYLDKLQLSAPFEENEAVLWGNLLEDLIAQEYARRTGQTVVRADQTIRHPERPWMLANLDRAIVGKSKLLEVKNVGLRQAHRYGDGPEDCAEEHICQAAWYCAVTGAEECDVAVLVGGQRLRIYTIQRDLELEALMVEAAEQFWFGHVQARVLPPPDGSESFKRYLDARFPRDTRPMRRATAEEAEWGDELVAVRAELAQLQERHDTLVNKLKNSMGETGGVFWGAERRITWKSTTAGTRPFVPNF